MFPMHTGFNLEANSSSADIEEFLKKVESMLQVLVENAVTTAAQYATAAGRDIVTPTDMKYAMMYEAHEFWNRKELEERFEEIFNDDSESEYCTDSESSESEKEGQFTRAADESCELAQKMNAYHDTWDKWEPEDTLMKSMKNAIDSQFLQDEEA